MFKKNKRTTKRKIATSLSVFGMIFLQVFPFGVKAATLSGTFNPEALITASDIKTITEAAENKQTESLKDGNEMNNMQLALSETPDNPINDPNGNNGDKVTIIASTLNATDLNSVYYTWKIEKSNDGATVPNENTTWTDITSDMMNKYASFSSADQQGLEKNSLLFLLNLPANVVDPQEKGVFYLKARVTAEEKLGTEDQTNKAFIVIKVRQPQNQIVAYSVIAREDGDLSLNNSSGTEPICNTQAERKTCDVTQNEIIGLQIPNEDKDLSGFSWKVNNVSQACNFSISTTNCAGNDNNVLFVPILGNIGESVNVVASAMNKKTGGAVEFANHFIIVEPQVRINSKDTTNAWAKLIGYYKSLDGNKIPDYSSQVLETNQGKTVTLNAATYSLWGQNFDYSWSIDGETQNNHTNQLSFFIDKMPEESYNIDLLLTSVHTPEQDKQTNNLRKALLKNWNVSPENSAAADNISTGIQLQVVSSPSLSASDSNYNIAGIFVSLITNLPEQLIFLLKITLTSLVLLFLISLLFTFTPESIFEKSKNK